MNVPSLGDITLAEYARLTRGRVSPWRKLPKVAGVLALCASLMAAGDLIGPWTGKHSRAKTLEEALELLDKVESAQWQTETGLGITHSHIERAIDRIGGVARDNEAVSGYASLYLRNIALSCIRRLHKLSAEDVRPLEQEQHLEVLREAARRR